MIRSCKREKRLAYLKGYRAGRRYRTIKVAYLERMSRKFPHYASDYLLRVFKDMARRFGMSIEEEK